MNTGGDTEPMTMRAFIDSQKGRGQVEAYSKGRILPAIEGLGALVSEADQTLDRLRGRVSPVCNALDPGLQDGPGDLVTPNPNEPRAFVELQAVSVQLRKLITDMEELYNAVDL
jgi:hypothetical protein